MRIETMAVHAGAELDPIVRALGAGGSEHHAREREHGKANLELHRPSPLRMRWTIAFRYEDVKRTSYRVAGSSREPTT